MAVSRASSSKAVQKLDEAIRLFIKDLAEEEESEPGMVVDFFLGFAVLDKDNHVDYSYVVPPNAMAHSSIGLATMCTEIMTSDMDQCDCDGDD